MDKIKAVNRLYRQVCTAVIMSFYYLAAIADEMDVFFEMSPEQLANIPVSIATGTAKPVYQSAAVTTVITAEQIRTMGATELSQVLETVPGLHVRIQGITGDAVYSMRGISNDVNAQVLVMLNGTRFSAPFKGGKLSGMELPVEAIRQIEVIRGPGSALYGADAFAGVINIITKKAKDIAGTEVGIRGGRWDTQSIWGMHGSEWQGWDIGATLQYTHNNNDGDRVVSSDVQSQFDAKLNTHVSLAPSEMQTQAERWNAHLNMRRKHWDIGFWAFNTVDGGLRAGPGGAIDNQGMFDNENYLADLRYSSEDLAENWEFSVHASYLYANLNVDAHISPEEAVLPINNEGNIDSDKGNLVFFPDGMRMRTGIESQIVSFDTSSSYKGFENHLLKITLGYRYEQTQTEEQRNFGYSVIDGSENVIDGSLTDVTATDFISLPDSYRSIWSVALQDEWQINADWSFTAGIRYDNYSDFGSTFNPRFALVWDVSEQLNAKLLYGRAYRAPSFVEQKQNSQLFRGNPNIQPETIDTVELAFDYRPISNLRLASNVYYYVIDNLIGAKTSEMNVITVENTAGQTAYGAEFEWDWRFHEQWLFKGNYAWQYARNNELNRRVRDVPEHQVYLSMVWNFLPQWQLQTQLNWIGHRLNAVDNENRPLNDYQTVDITLNSKRFFGHVDFSASIRNAFDTHGKEPGVAYYKENLPIASRSFYLEATLHF